MKRETEGQEMSLLSVGDFSQLLAGAQTMLELDFLLKKCKEVKGFDGRIYKPEEVRKVIIDQIVSLEKTGRFSQEALQACNPFLKDNFIKIYRMFVDGRTQMSMDA